MRASHHTEAEQRTTPSAALPKRWLPAARYPRTCRSSSPPRSKWGRKSLRYGVTTVTPKLISPSGGIVHGVVSRLEHDTPKRAVTKVDPGFLAWETAMMCSPLVNSELSLTTEGSPPTATGGYIQAPGVPPQLPADLSNVTVKIVPECRHTGCDEVVEDPLSRKSQIGNPWLRGSRVEWNDEGWS